MSRRILKGVATLMLVVGLMLVAGVATANGQSGNALVAEVPFEFVVGDKTLASGEYRLSTVTNAADMLMINNAKSRDRAIRLAIPIGQQNAATSARLVFHRYNNRYFLSEVWVSGDSVGRQLRKSAQERAMARELAAIPAKGDVLSGSYEVIEIVAMAR